MELFARTCNTEVMNVQRIMARLFVAAGALFWGFSAWGAKWAYEGAPFTTALTYAGAYAGAILAILLVGLFYEYLASAILAALSVAIVVFGVVARWEAGVWGVTIFFFVLPLVIAAALFAAAARMQRVCAEQR